MYWLNFKHFNWTFCESAQRQRVGKAHSPAKRPNSTCSRLPCAFWGPKWEPFLGPQKVPRFILVKILCSYYVHTCSMMFNVFGFKFILYTFFLRAHFASNSSTKCRSRRCTKCIKPWPAREKKNDGLVNKLHREAESFEGKQVCSWRSQPLPLDPSPRSLVTFCTSGDCPGICSQSLLRIGASNLNQGWHFKNWNLQICSSTSIDSSTSSMIV